MAKVFTITEGLENMGALKTGGQGSVYKARRVGEIITAVKILPTPIHSETADDKHFNAFQNEVNKLKKVTAKPNPNVVKLLRSGITESGSFPFIEMEFIEGPDLEELLKPPHDPIFTIKEAIKVAEQLSFALAHCHSADVKHGDIKSNNVKLNTLTGNYVLLDFGMSLMSDEQRRTSMRHAGAIEFMAPEQNEGAMLFETDVYSFGVIIYELLCGTVPFPLKDGGETSRNTVMISHMENEVPEVLTLRKQNLPDTWEDDKKERELRVPQWLLSVIYKCLEKAPQKRFATGIELHEAIVQNSISPLHLSNDNTSKLQQQNASLHNELLRFKEDLAIRDRDITMLKRKLEERAHARESQTAAPAAPSSSSSVRLSKTTLLILLFLLAGFGALATYSFFFRSNSSQPNIVAADTNVTNGNNDQEKTVAYESKTTAPVKRKEDPANKQQAVLRNDGGENKSAGAGDNANDNASAVETTGNENNPKTGESKGLKYTLAVPITFFHNEPDESTRRAAFLNHWNKAELTPLDERNGFVYVVYTNNKGQTSRGWLRKKDLKLL